MSAIISILGSRLGIAGMAFVVLIGGWLYEQSRVALAHHETSDVRKDLSGKLKKEQDDNAKLRLDLGAAQASNAGLSGALHTQNGQIAALALERDKANAAAAAAASQMLAEGAKRRAERPKGQGAKYLNDRLRALTTVQP